MHNCRTLLFHCSSVPNMTFFSNPCIYWIGEYSNIQEWHHFAAWVPFRPREPQTSTFTEKIAQFGVLDVFISAFLWVLLKLIVRAFRPRDHDRAADDLSLPLCAKPSTSFYNQHPIVFVFIISIGSFLYYCQYLCFMHLDPSRKYN